MGNCPKFGHTCKKLILFNLQAIIGVSWSELYTRCSDGTSVLLPNVYKLRYEHQVPIMNMESPTLSVINMAVV